MQDDEIIDVMFRRIEARLEAVGKSARKASLDANLGPDAIRDISRRRMPGFDRVIALSRSLDCSVGYLLGIEDSPQGNPIDRDEYTAVPVYNARAAAGSGYLNADHLEPLYYNQFRHEWLSNVTSAPAKNLAVIQVEGDSMYPTLNHGDHVLIDTTRRELSQEGIYALVWGDGLAIKRVTVIFHNKTLTISSDNKSHPTEEGVSPEDVQVIGRAIWLGRRI